MKLIQFQALLEREEGYKPVVAIIALDDEGQLHYRYVSSEGYVWVKIEGPLDAQS